MSATSESPAPSARVLLDPFLLEQVRITLAADEAGPTDADLDEAEEFDLDGNEEGWEDDDDLDDEDDEEWEDGDGDDDEEEEDDDDEEEEDDDLDDDLIDLDDEYDDFGEDDDRSGGGFIE